MHPLKFHIYTCIGYNFSSRFFKIFIIVIFKSDNYSIYAISVCILLFLFIMNHISMILGVLYNFWFYTEHFVHNNSRVWSKLYFFLEKDMSLHVQIGRLGVWVNLICSWAWSGIYCSFSLIQFITCLKYLEHSIIVFPSVGISGWILVRFFFVLNSQPAGFQNCT